MLCIVMAPAFYLILQPYLNKRPNVEIQLWDVKWCGQY